MRSFHKLKAQLIYLDGIVASRRNVSLMILGALIAFSSIAIRFFTIQGIEGGGDAVYKWGMIRQIVNNHYFPMEGLHHAIRWGINLPVYLVQLFFGDSPANYYIWPIFSSSITAVLCFLLVERMINWRWGILSAVSFITSWHAFRSGSQFLPMGPAVMFMLAALFFLLIYMQKGASKNLMASALMYFCSYGAKITAIYYLPAFLLLIILVAPRPNGKRLDCWKPLAIFGVSLLVLLIIETLLIYLITGHPGRIAALNYIQHSVRLDRIPEGAG
jgi:intracellular septation protein A